MRSLHRGEEIAAKGSRKQESVVERGKMVPRCNFFGTQINEVREHTLVSHIITSGLKQKCTQIPSPFPGKVFPAFSHGLMYFVLSVGSKNLEMEVSD